MIEVADQGSGRADGRAGADLRTLPARAQQRRRERLRARVGDRDRARARMSGRLELVDGGPRSDLPPDAPGASGGDRARLVLLAGGGRGGAIRHRHRIRRRGPLPDAAVPDPARRERRREPRGTRARRPRRARRSRAARGAARRPGARGGHARGTPGRRAVTTRPAHRGHAGSSIPRSRPALPGSRRRPATTRCCAR